MMIHIQKLIRLRYFETKHLRKINYANYNNYGNNSIGIKHSFNRLKKGEILYKENIVPTASSYSTSAEDLPVELNVFDKVCEETLESLTEFFEELCEYKQQFSTADISYSGGVLTINLGKYGTYVINRQTPNKQIWLSSPVSGPKRYDYVVNGSYWVYKHDMISLHELLQTEISKILGEKVDFSKCLHSKI